MKELLIQVAQNTTNSMSVEKICLNFLLALVLGIVIYISYRFSHSGVVYSARFNVSLLMLTLITTLIMNVIGNNIALSLGMVGALSIVRFRTAIKDPRDTAYIFWCIAVGISCGVSYYFLASVGTGIIFMVMLIMGTVHSNEHYMLIIHSSADNITAIEELIVQHYNGRAKLRVKNQGNDEVEYIYELTENMLKKAKKSGKNTNEALFELNGVRDVNLVCQNEELSR